LLTDAQVYALSQSTSGNLIDYDAAGNLISDKDGYLYTYDYENRIVKIEKPDGADFGSDPDPVAEFDYDTQGRRIRVYDAVLDTETRFYYSDNWQVLLETDYDSGTSTETDLRLFVYGNYIDEVLFMEDTDGTDTTPARHYYYLHDHLYSVVAVLGPNGGLLQGERYEYDAYGNVTIMDRLYSPLANSQYGNPYTFTGRRLDALDGGDLLLMDYRHRTYDPYTGRMMQHDPLATLKNGYVDGMNLYEYVGSNPLVYSDYLGMKMMSMEKLMNLIESGNNLRNDLSDLMDVQEDVLTLVDAVSDGDKESYEKLIDKYGEKVVEEAIEKMLVGVAGDLAGPITSFIIATMNESFDYSQMIARYTMDAKVAPCGPNCQACVKEDMFGNEKIPSKTFYTVSGDGVDKHVACYKDKSNNIFTFEQIPRENGLIVTILQVLGLWETDYELKVTKCNG